MLKVIPFKPTSYLGEDTQYLNAKLSFVHVDKESAYELIPKCFCRDFLTDVLISEELSVKINKYGFTYNPKETKIDRDKTRLLYTILDTSLIKNLEDNLNILHEIEGYIGVELTQISKTDTEDVLLVEGDNWWLQTTIHLSFYTFLLKCLLYEYKTADWMGELVKKESNESRYLEVLLPQFDTFLEFLQDLQPTNGCCGWSKYRTSDWNTLHHSSGFLSLLDKNSAWKREDNAYFVQYDKEFQLQK